MYIYMYVYIYLQVPQTIMVPKVQTKMVPKQELITQNITVQKPVQVCMHTYTCMLVYVRAQAGFYHPEHHFVQAFFFVLTYTCIFVCVCACVELKSNLVHPPYCLSRTRSRYACMPKPCHIYIYIYIYIYMHCQSHIHTYIYTPADCSNHAAHHQKGD